MVSKNNRFTTSFQVPSWDCGPLGRMFPVAMLRYFQESAVRHSDAEGGAFDRVLDHGLFWAMAGIRMNLEVLPLRGEKVSVTTWHAERAPNGIQSKDCDLFLHIQGFQ